MRAVVLMGCCVASLALAEDASESPLTVAFTVTDDAKAPLLTGEGALLPGRGLTVERRASRGSQKQSLVLEVRPLADGRLFARAWWNDVDNEGETVRWEPSFIVKRGGETKVRLSFPGGARVLSLTAG